MLRWVLLTSEWQAPSDTMTMHAAQVPTGVLVYLHSRCTGTQLRVPNGRTLTFIPGVRIVNGDLVAIAGMPQTIGTPQPEPQRGKGPSLEID